MGDDVAELTPGAVVHDNGPGPYLPLFIDDWLNSESVKTLSWEERAIYLHLLIAQWPTGSLPTSEDELASLIGIDLPRLQRAWAKLGQFFGPGPEPKTMLNAKLDKKRQWVLKQKANGRRGGRPQNPKITQTETQTETQNKSQAESQTETSIILNPNPNPNPNLNLKESPQSASHSSPPGGRTVPVDPVPVEFGDDERLVDDVIVGEAAKNKTKSVSTRKVLLFRVELHALREEYGPEVWRFGCEAAVNRVAGVAYAKSVMVAEKNRGDMPSVHPGHKTPDRNVGTMRREGGSITDLVAARQDRQRREREAAESAG